jgi:hypothetical protein
MYRVPPLLEAAAKRIERKRGLPWLLALKAAIEENPSLTDTHERAVVLRED